jgi:hypothetical protein
VKRRHLIEITKSRQNQPFRVKGFYAIIPCILRPNPTRNINEALLSLDLLAVLPALTAFLPDSQNKSAAAPFHTAELIFRSNIAQPRIGDCRGSER